MLRQSLLLTIRRRVLAATLISACAAWLIPSAFAQSTNFNALNALGITTGADTAQQTDAFTAAAVSSGQTSARLIAWAPKGITAGEAQQQTYQHQLVGAPDYASTALAHLLEKQRRLWATHRTRVDLTHRLECRRIGMADAQEVSARALGQLRFRRHRAAANPGSDQ